MSEAARDAERLGAMQTLMGDVWGPDEERAAALHRERALQTYWRMVAVLRGGALSTVAEARARLLGVDVPEEPAPS